MNKQFRITSDTLSPLYRATVGFEQLFQDLELLNQGHKSQGYPPYNITQRLEDEEVYMITLAVAGFKKSQIEIELNDGNLNISGHIKDEDKYEEGLTYSNFGDGLIL